MRKLSFPIKNTSIDAANRDHFDEKVEHSLRRDLPIITTPHAKSHLAHKSGDNEAFTNVYELDTFTSMIVDVKPTSQDKTQSSDRIKAMKVTAMPGKHVPPGILGTLNDLVGAVRLFLISWSSRS